MTRLGQPNGLFGIDSIAVKEIAAAIPAPISPGNIVPQNSTFEVVVTFSGEPADPVWAFAKAVPSKYIVECSIESIGTGFEGKLCSSGPTALTAADSYTVTMNVPNGVPSGAAPPNALTPGLYKVGAIVRFDGPGPLHYVGYQENVIVNIKAGNP